MKLTKSESQLVFSMIFLAVVSFFYVRGIHMEIAEGEVLDQEITKYEESIKPFLDIALGADAFAIYDTEKGQFVYKRNAEAPMPLASLAKIMSAIVIMENTPEDHVFTISKEALSVLGDNKLLVDEKWGRDELLKFTLVESSNDAVYEMASEVGSLIDPNTADPRAVFVSKMNDKARELKLRSLEFNNESGLDMTTEVSGAYGSARDVTKLFAYALEKFPEVFAPTTKSSPVFNSLDASHTAKNTNPIVESINGITASKTGFTNISGGNLSVAIKASNGENLVMTVLGSTFDDRFTDISTLSEVVNKSN